MSPLPRSKTEVYTGLSRETVTEIQSDLTTEGAEVKIIPESNGFFKVEARFVEGASGLDPSTAERMFPRTK